MGAQMRCVQIYLSRPQLQIALQYIVNVTLRSCPAPSLPSDPRRSPLHCEGPICRTQRVKIQLSPCLSFLSSL